MAQSCHRDASDRNLPLDAPTAHKPVQCRGCMELILSLSCPRGRCNDRPPPCRGWIAPKYTRWSRRSRLSTGRHPLQGYRFQVLEDMYHYTECTVLGTSPQKETVATSVMAMDTLSRRHCPVKVCSRPLPRATLPRSQLSRPVTITRSWSWESPPAWEQGPRGHHVPPNQ